MTKDFANSTSRGSAEFLVFFVLSKKKPPLFILINEREKLQLILGSDHHLFPSLLKLRDWFHFPSRERAVTRHLKFIVDSSLIIRKFDVALITFLFLRMIMNIMCINK